MSLATELAKHSIQLRGVIGNRVQPLFEPLPRMEAVPIRLQSAVRRAEEANMLARAQRAVFSPLADLRAPVAYLALRTTDVHSLAQLREIAAQLRSDQNPEAFSIDYLID